MSQKLYYLETIVQHVAITVPENGGRPERMPFPPVTIRMGDADVADVLDGSYAAVQDAIATANKRPTPKPRKASR